MANLPNGDVMSGLLQRSGRDTPPGVGQLRTCRTGTSSACSCRRPAASRPGTVGLYVPTIPVLTIMAGRSFCLSKSTWRDASQETYACLQRFPFYGLWNAAIRDTNTKALAG